MSLNDGQIPNTRVVRVHVCIGYNTVERNQRASRNGLVSDLPPDLPPLRFAIFSSLYTGASHSHRKEIRERTATVWSPHARARRMALYGTVGTSVGCHTSAVSCGARSLGASVSLPRLLRSFLWYRPGLCLCRFR
jgi:hypothetical protein